ncbi:hypothetical protein [Micromonospora robiginosa]|uniref:Uncharacterized protein n=1 Tax=Micromonospora robiginosa TaxID=2749844 RepID=A0A7L6B500_9ACTN|nr:hypothetical protein [Micromonospora ferruginea]QLQ36660.1 hypothetical protein H1D33_25895 [Micromonospora ferruginea]
MPAGSHFGGRSARGGSTSTTRRGPSLTKGLALLDSRAGRPDHALRRVDDGLARLTAALGPGERPQDLARLRHNRARG